MASNKKKFVANYKKYKNAYIETKNKKISRAVTMIFENKETVILLNNKKWNTYTDIGGGVERNESVISAAIRELREESMNLLNLDQKLYDDLPFIDIQNKRTYRWCRVYILCIANNINMDIYHNNKKLIHIIDYVWNETDNINKFNITDMMNNFKEYQLHDISLTDINGDKQKIYCDTLNELKQIIDSGILDSCDCVKLELVKYGGPESYLQNTETYYVV